MISREQLIDLLYYLGTNKVVDKPSNPNIQFSCTIHNESNPSAGVNTELGIFNCFSCGASGTLPWLVFKSLPDDFVNVRQAEEWLKNKYGYDALRRHRDILDIPRYDMFKLIEEDNSISRSKLAPFKSGKSTYSYFYDRGFVRDTCKDFMVGFDKISKTVTIPLFNVENKLVGVVGRYIDPNRKKNERYKIYDFTIGSVVYPEDKFTPKEDTIICVEGILDALWMHQLGFTNTISILGNNITDYQANFINNNCTKFIDMFDNDEGGERCTKVAKRKLRKDIIYYSVKYPSGKKDPQDCSKEEIEFMLQNKSCNLVKKLGRIS
jgi:DNA primase